LQKSVDQLGAAVIPGSLAGQHEDLGSRIA
jgi:hypothetical protein